MPDDALLADCLAGALTPDEEAALAADATAASELARQRQLDAALRVLLAPPEANSRAAAAILADFSSADPADRVCATLAPPRRSRHVLAWLAAAACLALLAALWTNRRSSPRVAPVAVATPAPRPEPTAAPRVIAEATPAPTPVRIAAAPTPAPKPPGTPMPLALATVTPPPLPAVPATPSPAPIARVEPRDASQWPFAASSPWNVPLGEAARLVPIDSPAFAQCRFSVEQQVIRYASATDPEVRLSARGQPSVTLRWPGFAPARPGERNVIAVLSPDRSEAIELIAVRAVRPQRIDAERFQRVDLRGTGFGGSGRSTTECGASTLGGVIRSHEVREGIRHALALVVPAAAVNRHAPGGRAHVWPATDAADDARTRYGTRGNLHVGSLLALFDDEEVARALETQGEPNRAVIRALRDYGAYIVGTHGDPLVSFVSEGAIVAPAEFSTLLPKLRVVADNSATNPGGAGRRRAAPAPPFGDGAGTQRR